MTKLKPKRLLSVLLSLAMVFTLTVTPVLADTDASGNEETTEETTEAATTLPDAVDGVITLTGNVTLSETWTVSGTVTLDLAGYTLDMGSNRITVSGGASLTVTDDTGNGVITSSNTSRTITVNGGTLTVNGGTIVNSATSGGWGCAAIAVFGTNDSTADSYSTVTVGANATLQTTGGAADGTTPGYGVVVWPQNYSTYDCYGVTVNISGTCKDAYLYVYGGITQDVSGVTFNLDGATVTGQYGIYAAGYAMWNITNSTINGVASGIEIRAGVLNVTNSTITASSTSSNTTENWSGATVTGAAIAVSQHSTSQTITVNVTDSEISGYYGVLEINNNSSSAAAVIVNISGDSVVSTTADDSAGAAVYSYTSGDESYATTVSVTGGTYNTDVSDYTTSTSAVVASTDDEGSTVYEVVAIDEGAVALVYNTDGGYTSYTTLAAAFAAATSGETVTMVADAEAASTISVSAGVTLDLNGQTITASTTLFKVTSTGALTVCDSGTEGEITISSESDVYFVNGAGADANVAIQSGTISVTSTGGKAVLIWNSSVNITGGTFTVSGSTDAHGIYARSNETNVSTIEGDDTRLIVTYGSGSSAVSAAKLVSGSVTIIGGTYNVSPTASLLADGYGVTENDDNTYTVVNKVVATVTIDGTATSYTSIYSALKAANSATSDAAITLTADIELASTMTFSNSNSAAITLDLTGCSITTADEFTGSYVFAVNSQFVLTDSSEDSSGSLNVSSSSIAAVIDNASTMTFSGGTINFTSTLDTVQTAVVKNESDASVTMSGNAAIITSKNDGSSSGTKSMIGISDAGGTVVLSGGSISVSSSIGIAYGISGSGASTAVTVSGGSITVSTNADSANAAGIWNAYVTMTDGTISAASSDGTAYGIYGKANSDSDDTYSSVSGGTVTVSGSANSCISGSISLTGGTYSHSDVSSWAAYGYAVYPNAGGTYTVAAEGMAAMVAASDNTTTYYSTLAGAVSAASSGDTVTLLTDVSADTAVIISGKTLIIDFNGYDYEYTGSTSYAAFSTSDGAEVTFKNSVGESDVSTVKVSSGAATCVLRVAPGTTVTVSADVTLENSGAYPTVFVGESSETASSVATLNVYGTITNTGTGAYRGTAIQGNGTDAAGGTVINIYDGAVVSSNTNAIYHPQYGTLNIYGGTVTGYCAIGISNGTLNISGGTITGTANDNVLADSYDTSGLAFDGSAIVLASSYGDVNVNITGGTIESCYSYAIRAYYRTSSSTTTAVTISDEAVVKSATADGATAVTSDLYIPSAYSEHIGAAISGGTFSVAVDPEYCADGYVPTDADSSGNYTVTKFYLGISTDESGTEPGVATTSVDGYGTSTLYVGVSASDISTSYAATAYPTTSLTFTETTTYEDGSEKTTAHNYIFAGWYSYSDDAYSAMESFPTDTAYAKFVDACFLTVQCYVTNDGGTYYWRFVTSLDTLYYNAAGFEIHVGDSTDAGELESVSYTKKYTIKNSTTKVEESADGETAGTTETISGSAVILPSQIHSEATYLVTAAYKDTESSAGKIKVTPYWVTGDGTTVYGNAAAFIYAYPAGE